MCVDHSNVGNIDKNRETLLEEKLFLLLFSELIFFFCFSSSFSSSLQNLTKPFSFLFFFATNMGLKKQHPKMGAGVERCLICSVPYHRANQWTIPKQLKGGTNNTERRKIHTTSSTLPVKEPPYSLVLICHLELWFISWIWYDLGSFCFFWVHLLLGLS